MADLFVNGRSIGNKMLAKAIDHAYQSQIPKSGFPFAVLSIQVDSTTVDVNVHPQKSEVKFSDDSRVYKAMFKALTDALTRPMSAAKTNLHLMPDSELNVFVKDMPPAKPSVQATTPLDRTLTDIQMPKQSREQRQQDNFVTDRQIFKTPERPSSTAVKPLELVPEEVPVPAQEHKSAQQQAMGTIC